MIIVRLLYDYHAITAYDFRTGSLSYVTPLSASSTRRPTMKAGRKFDERVDALYDGGRTIT